MATEGQFPKVDGDILYASEANKFANTNHYLYMGGSFAPGVSGNDIIIGSYLITPASLSLPEKYRVDFSTSVNTNNTLTSVNLSGTYFGFYTLEQSSATNSRIIDGYFVMSDEMSHGKINFCASGDSLSTISSASIWPVSVGSYVGSPFVFYIKSTANTSFSGYHGINVRVGGLFE